MEQAGFVQSSADPCVFVQTEEGDLTIVAVYVDDLIILTKTPEKMKEVKQSLEGRFKMKDLGKLHYCLGISIDHDEDGKCIRMHQKQYIQAMLEKFGLTQASDSS